MATTSRAVSSSGAGYLAYLTDDERSLNYYSELPDDVAFDRVWGSLKADLGLRDTITREQWLQLFQGRWNDQALPGIRHKHKTVVHEDGTVEKVDTRIPMHDITLSLPKSAVEYLVATDDETREKMIEAVWRAAERVWENIESDVRYARVTEKTLVMAGGKEVEQSRQVRKAARMLATPVMQFMARENEATQERGSKFGDPHWHIHIPVFSAVKVDEKWFTGDELGIRQNAGYRDMVWLGEVAREFEALGIELEYSEFDRARNGKPTWEIAGSNREARRYWSTGHERAWEARQKLEEELGRPVTEDELSEHMYVTRTRKGSKEQDSNPVWQEWQQDLERADIEMREAVPGAPVRLDIFEAADELRRRLLGPKGLCKDGPAFERYMVRRDITRCAVGLGFEPKELDGLAKIMLSEQGRDLLEVRGHVDEHQAYLTTTTMLGVETSARQWFDALEEQGRLTNITGVAGAGKSAAAGVAIVAIRDRDSPIGAQRAILQSDKWLDAEQRRVVRAIHQNAVECDQVVVVAVSGKTATDTGQKIKADRWGSIESITRQVQQGSLQIGPSTLLVVEESGMLDDWRTHALATTLGSDIHVVTLGDSKQLQAIGPGAAMSEQLDRHGSLELTKVRRQTDWNEVQAWRAIREDRAPEAVQSLVDRGRLNIVDTEPEVIQQVTAAVVEARDRGVPARDVAIVMEGSNHNIDTANRFLQRDRLDRGELHGEPYEVLDAEQARRWNLYEGDEVIFLQPYRNRGQAPVTNGTVAKVMKIDHDKDEIRVRQRDGTETKVSIDKAADRATVGLAYAVNPAKVQGAEYRINHYVPIASLTNAHIAYSATTRGIDETHVWIAKEGFGVDPVKKLGECWMRREDKRSAQKIIEEAKRDAVVLPDIQLDEIPELDEVRLERIADPSIAAFGERKRSSLKREELPVQELEQRNVFDQQIDSQTMGW